jgi:hypothetical protein
MKIKKQSFWAKYKWKMFVSAVILAAIAALILFI